MRGFRDALVLLVVLILQATLVHRIAIAGVRPDLLVAFVVYFSWMRGPIPGVIGGFTVGLFQDLDAPGPLGLNALAKTIVGFIVAKAGFRVHRSNIGVRFFFFVTAMLVHDLIYFGFYTAGDFGALVRQFVFVALPSALYTSILVSLLLATVERASRTLLLTDEV
ncbi:MAG: rod shape-determining protein MreD [Candidatus Eisenbacteria bacterium]|uniref:Rod shape-determining protein MreD n=1 Tax=Eiseniibacteriota bacterium TaxID=2212470 RepID=A0A538T7D6_UNCEI|nr:MAG: rod shape-determining protein MreD [Candidatus Eisenbacteria bacterium]